MIKINSNFRFLQPAFNSAVVLAISLFSIFAHSQVVNWEKVLGAKSANTDFNLASQSDGKTSGLFVDQRGDATIVTSQYDRTTNMYELRIEKYATLDGSLIWQRVFKEQVFAAQNGLTGDASGDIYLILNNRSDARVIKLSNQNGTTIWEHIERANGNTTYYAGSIRIDPVGNVILGVTRDTRNTYNAGIIKLAGATGAKYWASYLETRRSGGSLIDLDQLGNVFLTSEFYPGETDTDWETLKFANDDGRILWRRSFSGMINLYDYVTAIKADADGNIVVTGTINALFNGGARSATDIQTIKYRGTDGSLLWSRTATSVGKQNDYVTDLAIDQLGDVYIVGHKASTSNNPWTVIKYAKQSGEVLWEKSYTELGVSSGAANLVAINESNQLLVLGNLRINETSVTKLVSYNADSTVAWTRNVEQFLNTYDLVIRDGIMFFAGGFTSPELSFRKGVLLSKLTQPNDTSNVLNIQLRGNGTGQIVSTPIGITCESRCSFSTKSEARFLLSAIAAPDSVFLGWAGAGCTGAESCHVFISAEKNITATFQKKALPPISTRGSIDFDSSGKHAILITNDQGYSQIGRFSSNQILFSDASSILMRFGLLGLTPASADFNGDGKSDILVKGASLNIGSEFARVAIHTESEANNVIRTVKLPWRIDAVADMDGDGYADIVWRYTGNSGNIDDTGVSYIWFINSVFFNGRDYVSFSQVRKRGGAPLNWQLLGAADINGDTAADMVYISPSGDIRVLMASQNRTCANFSAGKIPATFTALRFADFSGKRQGDILVRNELTGAVALVSLDGLGTDVPQYVGKPDDQNASCTPSGLIVQQQVRTLINTEPNWSIYDHGDLDGNGIHDIVWQRPDGTLVVWLMQPNSATPQVILNAGIRPQGFKPVIH